MVKNNKNLTAQTKQKRVKTKRVGRHSAPTTEFSRRLGELLKKSRERKQLRQADLAKALDLAIAVYGRYERGEATLTVKRLLDICKITGISPYDILFELDPEFVNKDLETAKNIFTVQKRINNMTAEQLKVLLSLTVAFEKR